MASISIEDFLKNVYSLINLGDKANTGKLARRLNVSNAAITDMSRKLAHQGLINYEKYRDITLTTEGEKIALSVIRRHRLWEVFLNEVLGIPWEKVHDEAERLEHQTSDYLINEIDKFLDYPKIDPHGDPIPDESGYFAKQNLTRLTEVGAPVTVKLKRIVEQTGVAIEFLNDLNCGIGQEFTIKNIDKQNSKVFLSISGNDVIMPFEVAENLYVK